MNSIDINNSTWNSFNRPVSVQRSTRDYNKDPLAEYPTRLCAFSNEVGVAIKHISPAAATALWVPALMYIGADVYDKYSRGEHNDYSAPSAKEGAKQGVFQMLASVLCPTAAVLIGQNIVSKSFQHVSKNKLDARAEIELADSLKEKVKEGFFDNLVDDPDFLNAGNGTQKFNVAKNRKIVSKVQHATHMEIDTVRHEIQAENSSVLRKIKDMFMESEKHLQHVAFAKKDNVDAYLVKRSKQILALKSVLQRNHLELAAKIGGKKLVNTFNLLKETYSQEGEQGVKRAVNETLQAFAASKRRTPNLVKTIGGFAALAAAAIPIDYFVENIIIKKAVDPLLNKK